MRRSRIVGLLALLAGTASGCATATQRGDGLASIRARPELSAPPQRLVVATPTAPTTTDRAGVSARPEGFTRYFPGLQREAAGPPKVAKVAGRQSWLGRRLRGMGQGASSPTSLSYSTAPRSASRLDREPVETSVLPVSLTLPSDHPRDREVTPTTAVAGGSDDGPAALAEERKAEPGPTPQAPSPAEAPDVPPEMLLPTGNTTRPEAAPAIELDGANPSPPADATAIPPALDAVTPSPEDVAPAPKPASTVPKGPDSRERPRLAAPDPRARPIANPAGTPDPTPSPKPSRPKAATEAAKEKATIRAAKANPKAPAGPVAARPRVEDPAVLAARAHAATAHALGLPDPTLPSSYYRHDAPPVVGDAAVVATTAHAHAHAHATAPGVARPEGPCPRCGHDPNWRPSLQRFGRRLLGLGEFAPPQP